MIRRGQEHGRAKLSEANVHTIRHELALGWKHKDIASVYGVSASAISKISAGLTWWWLEKKDD